MPKKMGKKSIDNNVDKNTRQQKPSRNDNDYMEKSLRVDVSLSFVLGTLVIVAVLAFIIGRISIQIFLQTHASTGVVMTEAGPRALPPVFYSEKKEVPHTVYSSKHYDTGAKATSDTLLARRSTVVQSSERKEQVTVNGDGTTVDNSDTNTNTNNTIVQEELHEPSGQHLLIDIKSVNGVFLNTEEMLAQAMINLVQMSGLTMLSYHCHGLEPVGVSCVGVLLESHISFHTWPIQGVICLDLFTCGSNSLLPLLPDIERLFGIPRTPAVEGQDVEKPHMQWAHKRRGFRAHGSNPEDVDMSQFTLGWIEFDLKNHILSEETDYQTIDLYEVINPRFRSLVSHKKSLTDDGSYESQYPQFFRPDKIIYSDGIMQSRLYGEAAYHEALVHPAMISHVHPKRVAIIGGGEGATLREVLKHNTVEKVIMIEIDKGIVDISRKYIPEWSDCSMIQNSTPSCFNDPRAEIYYEDAIAWFINHFVNKDDIIDGARFDVVIMDALDPSSVVEFSDILYNNDNFARALYNSLTESGVFVSQMGEADYNTDAGAAYTKKKTEVIFFDHLRNNGFTSVQGYIESHGNFLAPWGYAMVFKDIESRLAFSYTPAEIDLILKDRAMKVVDGHGPLFRYFDGAAMMTYQYPTRVAEEVFCRDVPRPEVCGTGHGYDPEKPNAPITAFEVKPSTIPNAGRGVFAKEDIPKGAYIAIDEGVHNNLVYPTSTWYIEKFMNAGITNRWKMFDPYLFGYGYQTDYYGEPSYSVDPGIMSFTNHGCNGTQNISPSHSEVLLTEQDADPNNPDEESMENVFETAYYNTFVRRNFLNFLNVADETRRNIQGGEEILDNYLSYYTEDKWERGVMDLRAQCAAQGIGSISRYESGGSSSSSSNNNNNEDSIQEEHNSSNEEEDRTEDLRRTK